MINHYINNTIVPQTTSSFSIPIKICDGLFMSDHYIAQDNQFFQTNLITHVINCSGQQIQNNKKICNVIFLTFDWSENVIQNITQQKIINVTVNFIEQCKKQSGCLLIHYFNSQSRPFCLLACYFMVKFKWSLFKTLQFLNSRKQDVQLQPAFFQQLTLFAQKLQDKGLIKSKTWSINPTISYQQLIITNTYLNSKNKFTTQLSQSFLPKPLKNPTKSVTWKKDLAIQYKYSPHSIIQDKLQYKDKDKQKYQQKIDKNHHTLKKNNNDYNKYQRVQITNNSKDKSEELIKKISDNPPPPRNTLLQEKSTSNTTMTEMNATKKWAQLREMWAKQKQNTLIKTTPGSKNKQASYPQPQQKPPNIQKNTKDTQKFNDRLQQKLNLFKKHQQKLQTNHLQPNPKKQQLISQPPLPSQPPQPKTKSQNSTHQNSHQSQQPNNRVLYNNWIIDNHQLTSDNLIQKPSKNKQNPTSTNPCNKSVIIVKPNHCSSSLDNKTDKPQDRQSKCIQRLKNSSIINSQSALRQNLKQRDSTNNCASRNSLRKPIGSQRKQNNTSSLNKQNKQHPSTTSKFFRNQATQIITTKGRCSSAKPQRRDNNFNNQIPIGLGLSKNSSLKSKGKWQF